MTQTALSAPALELIDLEVAYTVRGIDRPVLRGVTLRVDQGATYGLVGESGCGKTTAAFAAMHHLPSNGKVVAGSIRVGGKDVATLTDAEVRRLRSSTVSMVYQNPDSALNPSIRVGDQLAEVFELGGSSHAQALEQAEQMLRKVQISDPVGVMRRFPHQLSGGMQQRVVIAMALGSDPTLLILDEPTTGLDATVEAEVLDLVAGLRDEFNTSVLFISHNLGVIRKMCDTVGVLYAGRLVEEGPTAGVFADPRHPYTVGLMRCIPRGGVRKDVDRLDTIPGFLPQLGADLRGCVFADRCALVEDICRTDEPPLYAVGGDHVSRCHFHERAQDLPHVRAPREEGGRAAHRGTPVVTLGSVDKTFRQDGSDIKALQDVSLEIRPGETLGLVGESGSGKTTLARVLLGLTAPDEGSVVELEGTPLPSRITKRTNAHVRAVQIVFQNPDSALNRRFSVRRILLRALYKLAPGGDRESRVHRLVKDVRFDERLLGSRPGQLSGGLKQRVAIARAFAGSPQVVVCDEPTSALDVSVQAAILNLLADLQRDEGVTYLFISHDIGVVRFLSDRIAVLYLGRVMEVGEAETVFAGPHHPYTEALLSAVPTLEGEERVRIKLEGEIPSHAAPPSGCVFHTRCPRFLGDICVNEEPPLADVGGGHLMRCHIPIDDLRRMQAEGASR